MAEWKELEVFLSKKNLYHVLKAIETEPKTLSMISQKTGIRFEHVSKYIKELIELGHVINLTPNIKKGKIFGISEPGRNILYEVLRKNLSF